MRKSGICHWPIPQTNFHSATAAEFAKCITTGTGGDIEVVTHPSGSLFKGGDIKRAIQTGQAPIGERLLSGHQNENAVFGVDSVPFLATSFEDAGKLWKAAKPTMEKILAEQNLVLLYSVPMAAAGSLLQEGSELGCRHGRNQVPLLQTMRRHALPS